MRNTQLCAFGGLTADRLLQKLRNRSFSWTGAKNVIIHVGTNDIFNINPSMYKEIISACVDQIRICNHQCIIFLSCILPRPKDFNNSMVLVSNFNEKLREIANSRQNVRIMYSDKSFYCRFGKPIKCLFSVDQLHLSTTGLNRIFHFLANTLAHAW